MPKLLTSHRRVSLTRRNPDRADIRAVVRRLPYEGRMDVQAESNIGWLLFILRAQRRREHLVGQFRTHGSSQTWASRPRRTIML